MGGFLGIAHRWPAVRVRPRTNAVAVVSDVVIDLRQAVVTAWETTIDAVAVAAEIRIIVPPGMRVRAEGTARHGPGGGSRAGRVSECLKRWHDLRYSHSTNMINSAS